MRRSGAPTARKFWLGARAFLLVVLIAGLAIVLPESTEATSRHQLKKLTASDIAPSAFFGSGVAVSGDTVIAGAAEENAGGADAGAAYVFQRNQGGADNWGEVKKVIATDAQAGDWFGRSLALSGDTAIVGAYHEDAAGADAGAAYVLQRDQGGANNWGELKKLIASDAQANDLFGLSMAVDGDTAIVGAPNEDAGGSLAGAAYIFHRDEGGANNWGEVTKLTASDAQPNVQFGLSVAVSGDTAFVGAPDEEAGGKDAGAVYVFQRDQGGADNWGEVAKLAASDAQPHDVFGNSVAANGDTTIVGAAGEDQVGGNTGAAYLFQRDQGGPDNWGEVTKLTASDADTSDAFGISVAVSGDNAIVGALREDEGGFNAGAAYYFRRDQGGPDNWGEVAKLTASDAASGAVFGLSVAVSADTAVIGAPSDNAGGNLDAGAAYVFDLSQPKPTPTITPTVTITPTPTITPTQTVTPTHALFVGGIALDSDLRSLPLETPGPANSPWAILAAIVAVASLVAAGGVSLYARRRGA